jgi:hypothetical protein
VCLRKGGAGGAHEEGDAWHREPGATAADVSSHVCPDRQYNQVLLHAVVVAAGPNIVCFGL